MHITRHGKGDFFNHNKEENIIVRETTANLPPVYHDFWVLA